MNSLKFTVMMLGGLAALPPAFADSSAPPAPSKGTPAPSGTVQDQQQMEQQLEQARQQLQQDARRVAELSMQLNGDAMTRMAAARERMEKLKQRGFLGIDLDDDDDARDTGVTVSGVTPGGPAEKAGLREGDSITGINGTSFKTSGDDSASDKLVEFMRGTKPGDSLKVAYSRDGKSATATVTAGSLSDMGRFSFSMSPMPPMPVAPAIPATPAMPPMGPWRGFNMFFGPGSHWGEMQLVAMTPGLGQYFGTDKGLLVLHMPKGSVLQLQEGDVIVQVGGRDPGTAPHAMRILSSYGPGESVKLDIMRKGKPLSLSVTMPKSDDEDSSSAFNWSGLVFDGDDDGSDQGR
jgi:C-terminal processing protease CtpA/Prc